MLVVGRVTSAEPLIPDGRLTWAPDTRIKKGERLAAFPHDPDRVWVTTEAGIMETADDGATWNLIPGTSREVLGRVNDVLFSPFDLNIVFIASREKGVLRSDDGGKTWRAVGTPQTGMAALNVHKLRVPDSDLALRSIYATHGGSVPGLSRSVDGGNKWAPATTEFFCEDVHFIGTVMLMHGARKSEPDLKSVFRSVDGGQLWADVRRDIPVNAMVSSQMKAWPKLIALQKGGICDTDSYKPKIESLAGRWTSLFSVMENAGEQEVIYAYDPYKHGLLASKDGFATYRRENDNLFVGPLVKEGAHVCCNANGSTFYALINGQVYVGRAMQGLAPVISGAKVTPGVFRVPSEALFKAQLDKDKEWPAKNLTLTVSARIT
ncbi:MAG TPA: hypothetical protein VEJ63_11600, partial [Planctomycetota bacterium]|nr:hypothetical protein [Planctomycetota bacterium]